MKKRTPERKTRMLLLIGIAALYLGYYGLDIILSRDSSCLALTTSSTDLTKVICQVAQDNDFHPALIAAVIDVESNFNPRAHSQRGAKGLMQIGPSTQRHLGLKNVWDPQENITAGVNYLRDLVDAFDGNLRLALAAYNAGPHAVKKHDGVPPYAETRKYVQKVMKLFGQYRQVFLASTRVP